MQENAWKTRIAGHRQRLRDRYLANGLDVFTDAEALELLLTFGTPRQDCKEMARNALERFQNLAGVLEAPLKELQDVRGIGEKNAFALKFVQDVARRYLKSRLVDQKLNVKDASDVVEYLWHRFAGHKREVFVVIFLDIKNAIIQLEELFEGSLTSSAVYPREVIKMALMHNASSMIFAHNHPSGDVEPSPQDFAVTKRLVQAARLFDMDVLDHIIIGDAGRYLSFADSGFMVQVKAEIYKQ